MKLFTISLLGDGNVIVAKTNVKKYTSRWIIDSRDDIMVSIKTGLIEVSRDYGATWSKSYLTSEANLVTTSFIFTNGNILFITDEDKMFLTDANLSFWTEKIMYEEDGVTPYVFTAPPNHNNFYPIKTMDYGMESDIFVWGNYTLYGDPVNIYYTDDFGATLKIAYRFTGNYTVRHVHNTEYNSFNGKFYCSTGDGNYVDGVDSETIWLEGEFNSTTKVWTWTKFNFGAPITVDAPVTLPYLKTSGWFFRQISGVDYIYWGAESRDLPSTAIGIWRSKISEFEDTAKHERIFTFPNSEQFKINDIRVDRSSGIILTVCELTNTFLRNNKLLIVNDYGHGNGMYEVFLDHRFRRITSPDNEGYFRADTKRVDPLQGRGLRVKVSSAIWDDYTIETINS